MSEGQGAVITGTTNAAGQVTLTLPLVSSQDYLVSVQAVGYKVPATQDTGVLTDGEALNMPFQITPGQATITVTVSATGGAPIAGATVMATPK